MTRAGTPQPPLVTHFPCSISDTQGTFNGIKREAEDRNEECRWASDSHFRKVMQSRGEKRANTTTKRGKRGEDLGGRAMPQEDLSRVG